MIKAIKREIEQFAKRIDTETEKLISKKNANASKYLPQIAEEMNAKADEQYKTITAPIRDRAKVIVERIIVRGESYISHSVTIVETEALNELRALKDIELDKVEFEILQMKNRGKYWPLRLLADMYQKKENTVDSILHDFDVKRPDSTAYGVLFQELRESTQRFIANYDGGLPMGSTHADAVWFTTLLHGDYLEKLEEQINAINPAYFITAYPMVTNTDAEKKKLNELFGDKPRAVVMDAIKTMYQNKRLEEDSELFGILSRSEWKNYLRELMTADGLSVHF